MLNQGYKCVIVFIVPILTCFTYYALDFYSIYIEHREFYSKNGYYDQLTKLEKTIEDNKVISLKAGPIHHYLFDLDVHQRYIFVSHPRIFYGDQEDNYWLELVNKKYKYIIANTNYCNNSLSLACKTLSDLYNQKYSFKSANGISGFLSFDLYIKK